MKKEMNTKRPTLKGQKVLLRTAGRII